MPAYDFPSHQPYREGGSGISSEIIDEMHGEEVKALRALVKQLREEIALLRRMLNAHRPTSDAADPRA